MVILLIGLTGPLMKPVISSVPKVDSRQWASAVPGPPVASTGIVPFPVDFATDYELREFEPQFRLGANLTDLSEAVREYIGLAAYYALGRSAALFPGPADPE